MKKFKFIGLSVAILGSVVALGSSIALYVNAPANTGFGIGAGTFSGATGTVTYSLGGNTGTGQSIEPTAFLKGDVEQVGVTAIQPEITQVKYEIALGATWATGVPQQSVAVGNLSVTLTALDTAYATAKNLKLWAEIQGYEANSIGKTTYEHKLMDSDATLTNNTVTVSDDIAFKTAGTQHLVIYVKFDSDSSLNLIDKNEANFYSLSVSLNAPSNNFKFAYVVGDKNQWSQVDEYKMAPNIDAASWEWVYFNLPSDIGEYKCVANQASGPDVWSSGSNSTFEIGKTTVTWSGSGSTACEAN